MVLAFGFADFLPSAKEASRPHAAADQHHAAAFAKERPNQHQSVLIRSTLVGWLQL